jgi:hypothetical protein
MKGRVVLSSIIAASLLTACGSPLPSSTVPSASLPFPSVWVSAEIDPAPGPTVTGMIADALGLRAKEVVAAVFLLRHPAGNGAAVWVFRAGDLSSQVALERWAASETKCDDSAVEGSLAGLHAVMIRRAFVDQCQPQYLVRLNDTTLAVITDDGGYAGNAARSPSVAYRPASDIGSAVSWVQSRLQTVQLQPGGPDLIQGSTPRGGRRSQA